MRIKFGSHLYGTSTPASDFDFKSVFVPDPRSILLQRAKRVVNDQRPKAENEKNYAGEVEEERFSLQRFLELASEGQTVALDVLFAPGWAATEPPAPEWYEIIANRHRLLTRKSAAFIGYARQQANKYGIRGSRVAASRDALKILADAFSSTEKLLTLDAQIRALCAEHEHMSLSEDRTPHGQTVILWEVCNRKMPFTASIKNAHDIMKRLVDEYGKRALMAESQHGVDWKALSHAVRVGSQAVELLQTGFVTFPLPNAAHVLEIKQGNLPYQDVAAEIEDWLVRVEAAAAASKLPDEPDLAWIDNFVASVYRKEVLA
ncbi:DNA polymerase beta superfamily protein [Mesorhizobium silamurunense]|uniref:DNA polymerase beta superfamily protein n=1 Tax=Mesorhizobium silamurunense TaxID=499528 RepID=UPI001FE9D023|nr:nucleotidyltransferase domain-containing protein [Mesorhizobium silamurunense]